MFERIQAFADINGRITPESIDVRDADVIVDPVTDEVRRGDLRKVDLPADVRQRIADFINAELGGAEKAAERLQGARAKVLAEREKAAKATKFGDRTKDDKSDKTDKKQDA